MRKTRVTIAALIAAAALALGACASDGDGGGGQSSDEATESTDTGGGAEETPTDDAAGGGSADVLCSDGGTVKIGIKFDQPGLGFQEGSDYTGFDVDVARYIADQLGCGDIEFISSPSAQRENMLQTGQVDMIVATYSITDARKEVVDFAGPYFVAGQDLLVAADDDSINGPDDLTGKNLCSVTGSTSAERVKSDFNTEVNLVEQPGYADCLTFLGGNVDAVTTDDIILAGLAATPANKGKFRVVGNPFSEENYGVGLPKGSTATCEAINEAITSMIDSGEWEKAVSSNTDGTGYTPNADLNPPTPAACS
ncbi:amino acid ABC transporter substrate-binding protein (PAAT family) [Salana multivorans]|uniref:Amino acid ABC transporter substrate-binding protein (PAAT family) n=1 Tax=Salana multivorans TaxID=120377 RepID=A0A3N2D2Z9_9MICO|nr:glutamate ABC transporter substrate-binding protein [Salana multivorans]MBN8881428.1 glutamate ABC transporter substrate-binding protein [Salana multivorans]OJX95629.1 MAG: ABC transporter substrate-binding protein [Micrococcales bacterium 73-15]ROR93874.1 amino acid ABC transporter substrate-binding protein (PAAT family) [Salana multivorans]